jgi:hypothetical protein
MAATAITWIYGAHLEHAPPRRYSTTKRTEYAFADLRRRLAQDLGGEVLVLIAGGGQQTDAKSLDRGGDAARGVMENRKLQFPQYSFYLSLILASAQWHGCRVVLSEDMQSGQALDSGVRIWNPFSI